MSGAQGKGGRVFPCLFQTGQQALVRSATGGDGGGCPACAALRRGMKALVSALLAGLVRSRLWLVSPCAGAPSPKPPPARRSRRCLRATSALSRNAPHKQPPNPPHTNTNTQTTQPPTLQPTSCQPRPGTASSLRVWTSSPPAASCWRGSCLSRCCRAAPCWSPGPTAAARPACSGGGKCGMY